MFGYSFVNQRYLLSAHGQAKLFCCHKDLQENLSRSDSFFPDGSAKWLAKAWNKGDGWWESCSNGFCVKISLLSQVWLVPPYAYAFSPPCLSRWGESRVVKPAGLFLSEDLLTPQDVSISLAELCKFTWDEDSVKLNVSGEKKDSHFG